MNFHLLKQLKIILTLFKGFRTVDVTILDCLSTSVLPNINEGINSLGIGGND